MANLIEDGDEIVVGRRGRIRRAAGGSRRAARRESASGRGGMGPDRRAGSNRGGDQGGSRPKLVAMVHAETSTGVYQPVEEIGPLAHRHGAMFVMDAVTSLGCVPVDIDKLEVDVCYTCTQKGIGAPPGLAPITFSPRAMEAVHKRKHKCRSWYLDVALIEQYWGPDRLYHHTAPITMNYALYEALRIVVEEGLEARWKRHAANAAALQAGLGAMGLEDGGAGGPSPAAAHGGRGAEGNRGGAGPRRVAEIVQHRDRRGARPVQGQGVADRADGRIVAARERDADPERAGGNPGRDGPRTGARHIAVGGGQGLRGARPGRGRFALRVGKINIEDRATRILQSTSPACGRGRLALREPGEGADETPARQTDEWNHARAVATFRRDQTDAERKLKAHAVSRCQGVWPKVARKPPSRWLLIFQSAFVGARSITVAGDAVPGGRAEVWKCVANGRIAQ